MSDSENYTSKILKKKSCHTYTMVRLELEMRDLAQETWTESEKKCYPLFLLFVVISCFYRGKLNFKLY